MCVSKYVWVHICVWNHAHMRLQIWAETYVCLTKSESPADYNVGIYTWCFRIRTETWACLPKSESTYTLEYTSGQYIYKHTYIYTLHDFQGYWRVARSMVHASRPGDLNQVLHSCTYIFHIFVCTCLRDPWFMPQDRGTCIHVVTSSTCLCARVCVYVYTMNTMTRV